MRLEVTLKVTEQETYSTKTVIEANHTLQVVGGLPVVTDEVDTVLDRIAAEVRRQVSKTLRATREAERDSEED